MTKKRDFFDSPLYIASNYIWYLFMTEFYFILTSFPLILTIAAYKENIFSEGFIFFAITFLLEGPAVTALLSTMGKLVREKDVNVTKDYFKAYKVNFIQSLFIWLAQFLIIFILIQDIRIMKHVRYGNFLNTIFYVVLFFVFIVGLYIYPILTRFYLKTKDLMKFSMFFLIVKIKNTLLLILIGVLIILMILFISFLSIIIFASIIAFALMYIQQDVIRELEEMKKEQDAALNK